MPHTVSCRKLLRQLIIINLTFQLGYHKLSQILGRIRLPGVFAFGVCVPVTRVGLLSLMVMVERMSQSRKSRREGTLGHVGCGLKGVLD